MDLFPKSNHVKENCYSLTSIQENDAASLFMKCLQYVCIQYGSNNSSHCAEHLKMIVTYIRLYIF